MPWQATSFLVDNGNDRGEATRSPQCSALCSFGSQAPRRVQDELVGFDDRLKRGINERSPWLHVNEDHSRDVLAASLAANRGDGFELQKDHDHKTRSICSDQQRLTNLGSWADLLAALARLNLHDWRIRHQQVTSTTANETTCLQKFKRLRENYISSKTMMICIHKWNTSPASKTNHHGSILFGLWT